MPVSTARSPFPDVDAANRRLEQAAPDEVVQWAAGTFADGLVMTTSFGAQSAVMLHLVTRVAPNIPVVLVDTGYLFPETYRFAQELTGRLKLNLKIYHPKLSPAHHEALHGRQWEQGQEGLERYNRIRKVEPLRRALTELNASAWLAGLRNAQTDHRATLRTVELQDGIYKIHPILRWTTKDVHDYLTRHDLPYHPLFDKGYASIGDTHTTSAVSGDADDRSGRFHGLRQECGIHLPTSAEEDDSRFSSGL